MPEPQPFAADPIEAIGYLRHKLDVPTRAWTDIWQDMHARAFVVAGAQSEQLLADFHEAVNRNIAEGRTLAQFRADFDRIVAEHGWSYRGSRNWRSAVIFNTNLRMATSAGRWAQIQRVKQNRPWLRYVAVMDERTRPLHRAWHDTVLPVAHEFWNTHIPPNGWNCRCTIQSLNDRDLTRYGLKPSPGPPPSPLVPHTLKSPNGPFTVEVPEGIDPGFAYNPGVAGFGRGADLLAQEAHGRWEPLKPPSGTDRGDLPLDTPRRSPLKDEPEGEAALRAALRAAIGGDEAVIVDPLGAGVAIGQAIVDHWLEDPKRLGGRERYIPLFPEIIEDPAEIWIGWGQNTKSGRVGIRRRYVKLVDIGGGRIIGLVCDADGRRWSGVTFFIGRKSQALKLRDGLRIYRREP